MQSKSVWRYSTRIRTVTLLSMLMLSAVCTYYVYILYVGMLCAVFTCIHIHTSVCRAHNEYKCTYMFFMIVVYVCKH